MLKPALKVIHADGNTSLELLYESHTVQKIDDNVTLTSVVFYADMKTTLNTEGVYSGEYLMAVGFNPDITEKRTSIVLETNEVK